MNSSAIRLHFVLQYCTQILKYDILGQFNDGNVTSELLSLFLLEADEEGNKEQEASGKKDSVVVQIDPEGLQQRIIAVNIPVRQYTGLVQGPRDYVF